MNAQPDFGELLLDGRSPGVQFRLVVGQQQRVIHVTQISRRPQFLPNEMVEFVQIEIRQELAGEVADRDTVASLRGREQIVPREIRGRCETYNGLS